MSHSDSKPHRMSTRLSIVGLTVVVASMSCWLLASSMLEPSKDDGSPAKASAKRFPVTVLTPMGPPRVDLGQKDASGQPLTVACSTCHDTRQPNAAIKSGEQLKAFHQGLSVAHGKLSCLSCHNKNNYDELALADGTTVEYANVRQLCAQCHGRQDRDFEHGAHGGMNGYWDLTRGPRTRNGCTTCHKPHAPAFPKMKPTFKPSDRFLEHHEAKNAH